MDQSPEYSSATELPTLAASLNLRYRAKGLVLSHPEVKMAHITFAAIIGPNWPVTKSYGRSDGPNTNHRQPLGPTETSFLTGNYDYHVEINLMFDSRLLNYR